ACRADLRRSVQGPGPDGPDPGRPRLLLRLLLAPPGHARERGPDDPAHGSEPRDADRARAGRAGPARGHQYRGDPGARRAVLSGVPRPLHHGDPGPGVPAVLTARAPGGGHGTDAWPGCAQAMIESLTAGAGRRARGALVPLPQDVAG